MFADEILDIVAMILISRLIGFHPLLLPTLWWSSCLSQTCYQRGPGAWRSS